MRRVITILVCSLFFYAGELSAQLRGQFYTGQDGHIYFQATNVSGSYFNAAIRAISNDRDNSETITVGQGFILGPTTPWKWYWKKGDRIYVTYPNGQSVYWECPSTDVAYSGSNVSFGKGNGYYSPTNKYVNIYTESGHNKGEYKVYLHEGKKYIDFYNTWVCIQNKSRFSYSGNWYIIK